MNKIRIGTRGSKLALIQTDLVMAAIKKVHTDIEIERVIISTKGDEILDKSLDSFGGKGVFVDAFEEALAKGEIDLAVHSAKDMPMDLLEGLEIKAVLARADVRDCLVVKKDRVNEVLASLDNEYSNCKMTIGTGSLRRAFQFQKLYPAANCQSIRGNVPTRLEKLRAGEYDGIILSAAGLGRLGMLEEEDLQYIFYTEEDLVPAAGQGVIAIEGRISDMDFIKDISDRDAELCLTIERQILQMMNGGCHEPIGVYCYMEEGNIEDSHIENSYINCIVSRELAGQSIKIYDRVLVSQRESILNHVREKLVEAGVL